MDRILLRWIPRQRGEAHLHVKRSVTGLDENQSQYPGWVDDKYVIDGLRVAPLIQTMRLEPRRKS